MIDGVSDHSRSSRTRCRRYNAVWTCAPSSETPAPSSTIRSSPSNTCGARCSQSSNTPRCSPASRYVTLSHARRHQGTLHCRTKNHSPVQPSFPGVYHMYKKSGSERISRSGSLGARLRAPRRSIIASE